MPNLDEHLIVGTIVYGIFSVIGLAYFKISFNTFLQGILIAGICSQLPDLDHKKSFIRKFTILFVILSVSFFVFLKSTQNKIIYGLVMTPLVIVGLYKVISKIKLKHRGMLHSIAANITILILSIAIFAFFEAAQKQTLFLSFTGAFSYSSHLMADRLFKQGKIKRVLRNLKLFIYI